MKLPLLSCLITISVTLTSASLHADVLRTNGPLNAELPTLLLDSQTNETVAEEIDWKLLEDRLVARGSMLYTYWQKLKTRSATYTEVELKAANAGGITVMHRGGVTDIAGEDLSPNLQSKLMFDPEEARDFRAGKRQPYLSSTRKRAVQDRIASALNQRDEAEVAAVEKSHEDYRLANERRVKAKDAWRDARETLLKMEEAYHKAKGQKSLRAKIVRQKQLVVRYEAFYRKLQAANDAMPDPLLR